MNKKYPTRNIVDGNLQEMFGNKGRCGIKNVIGLIVYFNNETLFYSILDDCFFRILPKFNPEKDNYKDLVGQLFIEPYKYQAPPYELKTFGMKLYDYLKKDFVTKEEIIKNKEKLLWGYYSDFDYEFLKTKTDVDYEDESAINDYIIETELEYEQKLDRPIAYTDGICTPSATKKLIK